MYYIANKQINEQIGSSNRYDRNATTLTINRRVKNSENELRKLLNTFNQTGYSFQSDDLKLVEQLLRDTQLRLEATKAWKKFGLPRKLYAVGS